MYTLLYNPRKMLSIHLNMSSLLAQRNLGIAHSSIATSLERLSTGFKINRASDNAANLAISKGMSCQLSGTTVALENAAHGMNILDTADGALANMTEKVNRIRDLCLKSMNGTYSDAERSMMQREVDKLTEEIYREKNSTTFSDIKLFESKAPPDSGGGGSPPDVATAASSIQTFNAGATRSVSAASAVQASEKPYLYELEYIESTGTQWIDTGIDISSLDYTIKANATTNFGFGYVHQNKANGTWLAGNWNSKNNNDVRFFYGDYNSVVQTANKEGSTYVFDLKSGKFSRDDTLIKQVNVHTGTDSIKNNTLPIFNWYDYEKGDIETRNVGSKCYSFQIYEGDTLVRDLVPVMDKNGVVCMYDTVSGQNFYNQGTGDFIAGPKIPGSEPPEPEQPEPNIPDTPTPKPSKPVEPTYRTGNIGLQIGANSGRDNQMDIDLAFDLDDFSADVTSVDKAAETLEKVDALKKLLSDKRSEAGAQRNRLDSVISAGLIRKENLGSSYSTIVDTDFASETTKLTKQQILQQASASLLSQANTIPSIAFKLLG